MTGDLFLDLLILVAGTAAMIGLSLLLGAWRSATLDETSAAARLALDEPDFVPARWIVDTKKRAAVALAANGEEVAFVYVAGDTLVTRRARRANLAVEVDGDRVILPGDLTTGKIALEGPDSETAQAWARALGGATNR